MVDGSGFRVYHQQPEVNYLPCFENDDLPSRLHEKHVVYRVKNRSRNRINSSLQVAGGRSGTRRPSAIALGVGFLVGEVLSALKVLISPNIDKHFALP